MNMASSYKTTLHFRFIETTSLYNILYSTIVLRATSDLGPDYKAGC